MEAYQLKNDDDDDVATTVLRQESPGHGGGDTTAFKLAQTRYRRRGNAPDRIDDLDELVDFSRGSVTTTSPSNDATSPPPPVASTHDVKQQQQQQQAEGTNGDQDGANHLEECYQHLIETVVIVPEDCTITDQDYYKGPLFTLKGMSGFYYAPNALSLSLQKALAFAAVSRYCEAPHVTNMDSSAATSAVNSSLQATGETEAARCLSLWESWKNDARETIKMGAAAAGGSTNGKANNHTHTPAAAEARRNKRSFQKLSWSTMGYHYDWNARSYNENVKSDMPFEIEQLTQLFATTSLLLEKKNETIHHQPQPLRNKRPSDEASFLSCTASACIVNYYNHKSLMGGHRDDLELALDKPIVSVSLGRAAVFLLGGHDKDDCPVIPIWVRPGDVMILGGKSRLRYHGMARLLPLSCCATRSNSTSGIGTCNEIDNATSQVTIADVLPVGKMEESKSATTTAADKNSFQSLQDDDDEMAMVDQFLTEYRINLSARQVYH
jgi:alkylated DNA repair dioxygenase AlkB